jgi:hypothetical protein
MVLSGDLHTVLSKTDTNHEKKKIAARSDTAIESSGLHNHGRNCCKRRE